MRLDSILKKYFHVVVMALLGLVAYFQAEGVTHFVGMRLAVDAEALAAAPGAERSAAALPALPGSGFHTTSGEAILSRNPFDSVTGPLNLVEESASLHDNEPPSIDYSKPYLAPRCESDTRVLIITAAEDPNWSMAAMAVPGAGNETQLRRIGDSIGAKRIWYIAWDRVWLEGEGMLCQVKMFDPSAKATAKAASKPTAARPKPRRGGPPKVPDHIKNKIQRVSDTEFNVDRTVVDQILENQADLMRSARIVPERKGDKVVGIRLLRVRPDTLLGVLGLQNGDRLEKINGFDITSPDKALEAYARLRTAGHLTVSITRRDKPVNIDFNIR